MKQEHSCTVENPQSVAYDFGAEGTMMWTRMVDKKWDDVKKQFLALGRGNEILVEEDTRLVFMLVFLFFAFFPSLDPSRTSSNLAFP